jgi:hypothetical protein
MKVAFGSPRTVIEVGVWSWIYDLGHFVSSRTNNTPSIGVFGVKPIDSRKNRYSLGTPNLGRLPHCSSESLLFHRLFAVGLEHQLSCFRTPPS